MEAADIISLLEQLDDNVDDLEEAISPILQRSVAETSKKLPVLDKAKLHVVITYALDTLVFSYLRLVGEDAKQHPVFRELARVRQYFEKIQALETEPEQRTMTLDKQAAGRFIKHGLAGNDKIDLERKEQQAKEKARAQLKATALALKAERSEQSSKDPSGPDSSSDSSSDEDDEETTAVEATPVTESSKTSNPEKNEKQKKNKAKPTGKVSKQQKKPNTEERTKAKMERKHKKTETRKARKTK